MTQTTSTITETNIVWIPTTDIPVEGVTKSHRRSMQQFLPPGQTVTIFFPQYPAPVLAGEFTQTITINEIHIRLQSPWGDIWTTLTLKAVDPTSIPPTDIHMLPIRKST